jgi:hypothetical protein
MKATARINLSRWRDISIERGSSGTEIHSRLQRPDPRTFPGATVLRMDDQSKRNSHAR